MLTSKLTKFVEHYTGDCEGNAAKAAESVGCSKTSAKVTASRWMKKPDVQEAIANRRREIVNRGQLEADEQALVVRVEYDGKIADVLERRAILTAIARMAKDTDRVRALDVLNKMDGVYIEKHQHEIVPLTRVIHEDAEV